MSLRATSAAAKKVCTLALDPSEQSTATNDLDFSDLVTFKTTRFVGDFINNYSLEHVLAELVNSGPQSPGKLNAKRAESLLRRSLTWCVMLNNTLSIVVCAEDTSPAGLMGPFFDLSAYDSDAARWILERIRRVFPSYEGQKEFLSLYLLILLQSFHEENVKAQAALNLAEILEDALEKGVEVEFANKWARVSDHLSLQSEENIWSRELTENVLRLQGSLLTLKYSHAKSIDSTTEAIEGLDSLDLRRWAINLRSALSEETVRILYFCSSCKPKCSRYLTRSVTGILCSVVCHHITEDIQSNPPQTQPGS